MLKDGFVIIPGAITALMLGIGIALFAWHLAIHPDRQLEKPDHEVPSRSGGLAALIAVASRHNDETAVRFTPVVHTREYRNYHRHLRNAAAHLGWYAHDRGKCQSLVLPERDLHMLHAMESDPVGWVSNYGNMAASDPPATEPELVNAAVCAWPNMLSGFLRVMAILTWLSTLIPGFILLAALVSHMPYTQDPSPSSTQG